MFRNHWMITCHEITTNQSDDQSFSLPVFAFVFHKMKPNSSLPLVYVEENSFSKSSGQLKKDKTLLKNPAVQLKEWIAARQRLSVLYHSIQLVLTSYEDSRVLLLTI